VSAEITEVDGQPVIALGTVPPLTPWGAATLGRALLAKAEQAGGWAECRYCGAPMLWVKTEKGGTMPLDIGDTPGPVAATGGLVATGYGRDMVVRWTRKDDPIRAGEHPVTTHFASCPRADEARADKDAGRKPPRRT
jgi:hypothetical protein